MIQKTEMEWTYTPPDLFELPYVEHDQQYQLTAADGRIQVIFVEPQADRHSSIVQLLRERVRTLVQAMGVSRHVPASVTAPTTTQLYDDGPPERFLEVEAVEAIGVSDLHADFQIHNAAGELVADSKAECVAQHQRRTEAVARHAATDRVLAAMVESAKAAVRDPANELLHLYEIRDALATRFGGEPGASTALGLGTGIWTTLGRLANQPELQQGRHRGRALGETRAASDDELRAARDAALAMIDAYLAWLDQDSNS